MIGIFGGTFDPVHIGHRSAIDQLCESLPLQKVHWVLSARPPHKDQVSASISQRFAMLKLALADQSKYLADDTEIKRPTKSYTIDTVEAFKRKYPDERLCVVIGADSLQNLHTWRQYDDLMRSVNWLVMHRPRYPLEVPRELTSRLVESPADLLNYECGKVWLFSGSHFDVSSTEIRNALSAHALDTKKSWQNAKQTDKQQLVREFLSQNVIDYIRTHNLYTLPK